MNMLLDLPLNNSKTNTLKKLIHCHYSEPAKFESVRVDQCREIRATQLG